MFNKISDKYQYYKLSIEIFIADKMVDLCCWTHDVEERIGRFDLAADSTNEAMYFADQKAKFYFYRLRYL